MVCGWTLEYCATVLLLIKISSYISHSWLTFAWTSLYCDSCKMVLSNYSSPCPASLGWHSEFCCKCNPHFSSSHLFPPSRLSFLSLCFIGKNSWIPYYFFQWFVIHQCSELLWHSHGFRFGQWEFLQASSCFPMTYMPLSFFLSLCIFWHNKIFQFILDLSVAF